MKTLASFLLLLPLAANAAPEKNTDCRPVVEQGWIRLLPNAMPMHGGFARFANACAAPASIVSAHSDAYEAVELHETTRVDGVSRMRQIPALALPARGEVRLQPGGLHLMLMRPRQALAPGQTVRIVFTLADGRTIEAAFVTRQP